MEEFQLQTAEYIREMARQLALLAHRAKLYTSADLLKMVHEDAGEQMARFREQGAKRPEA